MKDFKFTTSDISEFSEKPKKKLMPDGIYLAGIIGLDMVPNTKHWMVNT